MGCNWARDNPEEAPALPARPSRIDADEQLMDELHRIRDTINEALAITPWDPEARFLIQRVRDRIVCLCLDVDYFEQDADEDSD